MEVTGITRSLILDDPWACGDTSHLSPGLLRHMKHNVWISSGSPEQQVKDANDRVIRDIPAESDKATLVLEEAWAYNYKYHVYTHGLFARKEIADYAPLLDYPDEVEKRNFQQELRQRLIEMFTEGKKSQSN